MKGKISLKTIIIFAILILVMVLLVIGVNVAKTFMSGATADYEPQNLTAVSGSDGKSATISWTSSKEAEASVFYGTNMASLLLMAKDSAAATDHNIVLSSLKPGTTYYYKIVIDNNNVFDNGGTMFSFKTNSSETDETTETPAVVTMPPVATISPVATTSSPAASPSTGSASSADTSTCNKTTDYIKDGVINSLDYLSCLRGKLTPTKAASKK